MSWFDRVIIRNGAVMCYTDGLSVLETWKEARIYTVKQLRAQ